MRSRLKWAAKVSLHTSVSMFLLYSKLCVNSSCTLQLTELVIVSNGAKPDVLQIVVEKTQPFSACINNNNVPIIPTNSTPHYWDQLLPYSVGDYTPREVFYILIMIICPNIKLEFLDFVNSLVIQLSKVRRRLNWHATISQDISNTWSHANFVSPVLFNSFEMCRLRICNKPQRIRRRHVLNVLMSSLGEMSSESIIVCRHF